MDPRLKRALLFLLALAVLVLLYLWWREKEPAVVLDTQTPVQTQPVIPLKVVTPSASSLTVVAKTFVERFGSFSSEASFANVEDVRSLVTLAFFAVQNNTASAEPSDVFIGTSTRVLSTQVLSLDENAGTASVRVQTQREQRRAQDAPSLSYPFMNLTLLKEQGVWKVDSATWQPL